jgi:ADP-heptose:LPS heptosyltransferase
VTASDSAPRRIALIRLSHLGDVVLALPVFHALRARWPDARIAWVVQREFAPLIEPLPGLERAIRFERRGGLRAWLALRDELASFSADLAVDAQGNWKSGFALACSGAPRRVALARRDRREPRGAFAATETCAAAAGEHAFDRTLALCRHLSDGSGSSELACESSDLVRRDPALSARELESGARELERRVGAARAVLLQLSPESDVRSWPVARAIELARALARAGRDVLVLSGPAEEREGAAAAEATRGEPRIRSWVGQRGLRELAALFTAAASRGASYAGADTGPTHLAAACGLPVTILCGPHSHLRTGPWPVAEPSHRGASPHRAVRAAAQPDCAPCFARTCRHRDGPVCMTAIEVEDVLAGMAEASSRAACSRPSGPAR